MQIAIFIAGDCPSGPPGAMRDGKARSGDRARTGVGDRDTGRMFNPLRLI
jgi:hypothetical protein